MKKWEILGKRTPKKPKFLSIKRNTVWLKANIPSVVFYKLCHFSFSCSISHKFGIIVHYCEIDYYSKHF